MPPFCDRGNQTQEQIKKDFDGTEKTQTTEYTYNLLNRMTSATVTATGETTQTVSNTYSAKGQRIKKLENGGTTNYYYVGDEVQLTTTQNAFMLTENVLSPQGNIIASKRFPDDNPGTPDPYANKYYFYNYDLRGSVTSIIKPDGSRVKDYTYDEFGKLESGGEQDFLNETTYTGSVKDKSTGLQYMNARYYEPETGRFLTQDTYTGNPYDPWTQHLYSYCGNNPTSMVDPTGHFAFLAPLIEKAVELAPKIISTICNWGTKIASFASRAWGAISNVASKAWGTVQKVGKWIKSAAKWAGNAVKDVGKAIGDAAKSIGNWVSNSLKFDIKTYGGDPSLRQMAEVGARSTNAQKVIGHYPEYIEMSNKLGTKPFSVPERIWNTMSSAERWAANQRFLDRAISKGSEFVLATPIDKVRAGSYLQKEIEYLTSQGYKLSADSTKLVK